MIDERKRVAARWILELLSDDDTVDRLLLRKYEQQYQLELSKLPLWRQVLLRFKDVLSRSEPIPRIEAMNQADWFRGVAESWDRASFKELLDVLRSLSELFSRSDWGEDPLILMAFRIRTDQLIKALKLAIQEG